MAGNQEVTFVPEGGNAETEQVEQLQDIKSELEEIKEYTVNPKWWFARGLMQGAGALVGSILALILVGWLLALLGFIPGLGDMARYVASYLDRVAK